MKSTLFASTLAAALTGTSFGQVNVTELASCHYLENDWSTSISSPAATLAFEDLNNNGLGYIAFRVTTTSESAVDYTFDAWNSDFDGVQVYGLDDELCNGLTADGPSPWKEEIESSSDGSGTFLLPAGDYFVMFGEARSGTVDITSLSSGNVSVTELASCHYLENDWSTSISSPAATLAFEDLNNNGLGYIAFRVTTTSESAVDYTFDAWNSDFDGVQVYGLDDELCNGLTADGPSPWKEEIESSSDGSGTFLLPAGDYFVMFGEARSGTIRITSCIDSDGDGVSDDSDGDGVSDCVDNCPDDPNKTDPGACGCGNEDTDTDGDGVDDCVDNCPDDPNKTDPGVCGCGNEDTDTDGDGTADCVDNCPDDPDKTEPGFCGCGTVDTNVNGDVDCDGDFDEDDALAAVKLFGLDNDDCPADVDGDGSIGFSDVLIILNDWGACP